MRFGWWLLFALVLFLGVRFLLEAESSEALGVTDSMEVSVRGAISSETEDLPERDRLEQGEDLEPRRLPVADGESGLDGESVAVAPGGLGRIGRVVDVFGAPIANANVVYQAILPKAEGAERVERKSFHATSDVEGMYSIPGIGKGEVSVSKPGFVSLRRGPIYLRHSGGQRLPEWALTPETSLAIHVSDSAGVDLTGVSVRVAVDESEFCALPRTFRNSRKTIYRSAVTDESGRALFSNIAALQRLFVWVGDVEYRRVEGDGALSLEDQGTLPILLRPGSLQEMHIQQEGKVPFKVQGNIREPDGRPSPKAIIVLLGLAQEPAPTFHWVATAYSDEDGKFLLEGSMEAGDARAMDANGWIVTGEGTIGAKQSYSPFGGTKKPDPLHKGSAQVASLEPDRPVEIRLKRMATLSGHVVDLEGNPLKANITVRRKEGGMLSQRFVARGGRSYSAGSEGNFRIAGVPPGVFDLSFSNSEHGTTWIRDLQVGDTPIEKIRVTLRGSDLCHVEVVTHSELDVKAHYLLQSKLHVHAGAQVQAPTLAASTELRLPLGWPDPSPANHFGRTGYDDARGMVNFYSQKVEGGTRTYTLLPGYYWFGAKATLVDGGLSFPTGTGLVRLEPGHHRIEFHLGASGSLRAILNGLSLESEVYMGVAIESGEVLSLLGPTELAQAFMRVPTSGQIDLPLLPVGKLELRLGAKTDLMEGRATIRLPFVVQANVTNTLQIDW